MRYPASTTALSFGNGPHLTATLSFLSSREVVTFFEFAQEGLLIDVATAPTTALALGNVPLVTTTLSFLSSRPERSGGEGSAVPRTFPGNVFSLPNPRFFLSRRNRPSRLQPLGHALFPQRRHHRKQTRSHPLPGERDPRTIDQRTRLHALLRGKVA